MVVATVALAVADFRATWSALLGGGINMTTTLAFAWRVFTAGPGSTARQITRAFYVGEVIKLLLTVVLFTAVLLWLNVSLLPLFLTYAATMLAFWLVLLLAL